MKGKSILFATCILAMLVCIGLVSAATTFSVDKTSITFNPETHSNTFTITNLSSSLSVTLSLPVINGTVFQYSGNISGITSGAITITPTNAIDFSAIPLGDSYFGNLTITDASNLSETQIINVILSKPDFCDFKNDGNDLKVSIDEIVNNGLGDDKNWYPIDEIEFSVDVENKANYDMKDVLVEWALYDKNSDLVSDFVEIDTFDLDEDDDAETLTFSVDLNGDLNVDIDELKNGDYTFYVRATAEIDDGSLVMTCGNDNQDVSMIVEKNYVVLKDIKFLGTSYCGGTMQLSASVWNLGSKDQDNVYVTIVNNELGLNERADIGDISAFDDKKLKLEFMIPQDAGEKQYHLNLEVYDEDDDIYESDGEESRFQIALDVAGNCQRVVQALVYASLESGGKAGQEMKIRASVTNTGDSSGTFTISAADYSNWAELVSISPVTVTLNSQESKDVLITLNVDSDVSDEQTFNVVLEKQGGDSITQPISVTIEKGFSLSGMLGGNAYIWGIALINVVLVTVIIIVAVKAARR
jgi:hypothetical protein